MAGYELPIPERVALPDGETLICVRRTACGAVMTDQEISAVTGEPMGDRSRCPDCARMLSAIALGMTSALRGGALAKYRTEAGQRKEAA